MLNKTNGKLLMNMTYMYLDFYKVPLNCLMYLNLAWNVLFLIIWKMLLKSFIISICALLSKKIKQFQEKY